MVNPLGGGRLSTEGELLAVALSEAFPRVSRSPHMGQVDGTYRGFGRPAVSTYSQARGR